MGKGFAFQNSNLLNQKTMSVQNQGADPVKVAFKDGAVKESTEGTTSTTHGNIEVDAYF